MSDIKNQDVFLDGIKKVYMDLARRCFIDSQAVGYARFVAPNPGFTNEIGNMAFYATAAGFTELYAGDANYGSLQIDPTSDGTVTLETVRGNSGSAAPITIQAGNGNTSGNGGSVNIESGAQAGGNTNGDVNINTKGKLKLKEVADSPSGVVTLVGGTLTVNNANITANSRIFLTHQNNSGTVGFVTVSARVAGTSFTITSSNALDTSDIAYFIIEPF